MRQRGRRARTRPPTPLSHQASRRRHPARLALPAGRNGSRSRCCGGLRRRSSGARCGRSRPGRSRRGRGLRRGSGGGRGGRLVAARLRPLVDVAHSAFEQLAHVHVGLGAFFDLVGHHRLGHVTPNQALERKVGPFELGRMMNRAGRTRLAAQAAVHALGDIDIELRDGQLTSLRVFLADDHDAVDRTGALAGEASGANLQVDVEDTAVAERQRVLHAHRRAIGVLDGVRAAKQMRRAHRHPVKDGDDRVLDMAKVFGCRSHRLAARAAQIVGCRYISIRERLR